MIAIRVDLGSRSHRALELIAPALIVAALGSSPSPTAARPLNDSCGSAAFISSTPFSDRIHTADATASSADPLPLCSGSSLRSVFYRITVTSPETALITADTFGSDYDTVLSVYTGHCSGLIPLANACNDDAFTLSKAQAGPFRQSRVAFYASPGTTYYLMVTAYNGDGGTLVLNVDDPPGGVTLESCALDPGIHSRRGARLLALGAVIIAVSRKFRGESK